MTEDHEQKHKLIHCLYQYPNYPFSETNKPNQWIINFHKLSFIKTTLVLGYMFQMNVTVRKM